METPDNKKDNLAFPEKDRDSFRKHNERMKMFCLAHPMIEIREARDVDPERWLIPLPPVDPGEYAQN